MSNYNDTLAKEKQEYIECKSTKQTKNSIIVIVEKFIKRIVDLIAGIIGTVILIPITLVVFALNKINKEDGPVFYEQLRIGKMGKYFRIYKFRSMCMNADEKLKKYLEENEDAMKEFKENYKLKEDPRITKTGRFLRQTSLDEWPQFINLLNGTMSLIGPRPIVKEELEKYGENKEKFLSMKPGLTGYWQVNGRSNTSYKERIEMELYYADNFSLYLDLKILLKTFLSVIKKEGAI